MGLFGHRPGKDWERAMATVITAEQTNRAVSVGLARCGEGGDYVVDRFTLDADDRGRLDLMYAGANLCVLELRSVWR